jgi:predicted MFS family arabinose efflux permease
VWGVATIACGLTGNFMALLIARAALGLGEAGYGSAGGAILLQVFPTRMHSTVLGTFLSGSLFGSVLGLAVGGVLAQTFGWQKAFMTVGAFGLVLALVFPLVVREPSARTGTSAARVPMREVTRALLTTRTAVCVYLGLGATMFVQGAVIAWASSYFNRYLAMDPADAAKHAGLLAVCSGIGMIGGGYVVDRLSRQDKRNRLRIPALFAFCSGLILLTAFLGAPGVLQLIVMGAGLMVGAFVIGSCGAVLTDVVPAAIHATALATLSLAMNLLGSAPGPVVIGWIADQSSLQTAMKFLPLLCFVSAVTFAVGANFYEVDRRRLHG